MTRAPHEAPSPAPIVDPFALAALSLAVVTVLGVFCCVGYPAGVLSIVLGIFALVRTKAGRSPMTWIAAVAGIGCSLVAMLGHLTFISISSISDTLSARERASVEAARLRQEAEEAAADAATLAAEAPSVAESVRVGLTKVDAAIALGDAGAAKAAAAPLRAALDRYPSQDPQLSALQQVQASLSVRETVIEVIDSVGVGDDLAAAGDVVGADGRYAEAAFTLAGLPPEYVATATLPFSWSDVEKRRKRIAKAVARELRDREQAAAASAERAARAERIAAVCGATPDRDWGGGILQVKWYMEQNANDPDSIEVSDCTTPVLTDACWRSSCRVRGKNGFGALVLNEYTFYIAGRSASNSLGSVLAME